MDNSDVENTVQAECEDYPSARFLLDSCFQDYQRILDNYNKIYEKINIALAFSGVILTIMLGAFDFSPAKFSVSNMKIWEVILTSIELTCLRIVMSEGTLRYGSLTESYDLIGFDNNNVFVIGNMTGQQAVDRGIRDAVSFGPFLILNGTPLEVSGMGGGLNPRTAIGQRADGAVLLLIIDGRQAHSLGASMNDLINEMLDFGAVNAANLDGGGSTVLY